MFYNNIDICSPFDYLVEQYIKGLVPEHFTVRTNKEEKTAEEIFRESKHIKDSWMELVSGSRAHQNLAQLWQLFLLMFQFLCHIHHCPWWCQHWHSWTCIRVICNVFINWPMLLSHCPHNVPLYTHFSERSQWF